MWIADRRESRRTEESAALGQVTLGGDPAGVFAGGERRWLPVYAPGGYRWRPQAGEKVLVVQAGQGHEAPCVVGARQSEGELEPGEVRLTGGTGGVRLYSGGVELTGGVKVNGQSLNSLIDAAVAQALAAGGGNDGT